MRPDLPAPTNPRTHRARARSLTRFTMSALCSMVAVSCSIPTDPAPVPIPGSEVPAALRAPSLQREIYLVGDRGLTAVERPIRSTTDRITLLRHVVEALQEPLTAADVARGLRSDLAQPACTFDVVSAEGRRITVDLVDRSYADDSQKLGQIVWSLTDSSDDEVVFTLRGRPIASVKNADGADVDLPVGRNDYPFVNAQVTATIYLVKGGRLAPVERRVSATADRNESPDVVADRYLLPLEEGPNAAERALGYSSLVSGLDPAVLCATTTADGTCSYQLDLSPKFLALTERDQALALGQLLYTLDGWPRSSVSQIAVEVNSTLLDRIPTPNGPMANPVDKSMFEPLLSSIG